MARRNVSCILFQSTAKHFLVASLLYLIVKLQLLSPQSRNEDLMSIHSFPKIRVFQGTTVNCLVKTRFFGNHVFK